jgi:hypothetical protein
MVVLGFLPAHRSKHCNNVPLDIRTHTMLRSN